MSPLWEDPRVARGMERQIEARRSRLAAGEKPIGWKVAFGSPHAMEMLAIDAPLVGFLTDASPVESGSTVRVGGWQRVLLEPEVAIHVGTDVPPGIDRAQARSSIAGLGLAIELAEPTMTAFEDPEAILAVNIFQRHVVLGPMDATRAGARLDDLDLSVTYNDEATAVEDPTALTGDLVGITSHVADLLRAFGLTLSAGDVIIAGSCAPPVTASPGDELRFSGNGLGSVSVSLAD